MDNPPVTTSRPEGASLGNARQTEVLPRIEPVTIDPINPAIALEDKLGSTPICKLDWFRYILQNFLVIMASPHDLSLVRIKPRPGVPYPLGATCDRSGVNFALASESATAVELCLFDDAEGNNETGRFEVTEQTDHVWHIYLPGIRPGQRYGIVWMVHTNRAQEIDLTARSSC